MNVNIFDGVITLSTQRGKSNIERVKVVYEILS